MPLPSQKRYLRSTSKLPVTSGLRSSIRQALAVVPPMSKRHQPVEAQPLGEDRRPPARRRPGRSRSSAPGCGRRSRRRSRRRWSSMISGRFGTPGFCQPGGEAAQIGLGDRRGVGVDRGGRGARIFADLRRDRSTTARGRGPGASARSTSATRLLVGAVAERVDQADRHRGDARGPQRRDQRLDLGRRRRRAAPRRRPACARRSRRSARAGSAAAANSICGSYIS